ncbi:pectate lyase [Auriculariales sp. MPI-PUGE-AT-0066]|nr:pectate lyase [Auriculariales sp. MPI-PUGE-AT-0066]
MQLFKAFAALAALSATVSAVSYNDVADIGYATLNGGTTGGSGGPVTTVTTLSALTSAVSGTAKKIVVISGTITGAAEVRVGSNTTVIGAPSSSLVGIGLRVQQQANVIIRNVKISKVLADNGDALAVQISNNVWLDHVDVSSDKDHDKDYYDGLIDLTHGVTYTTVSNSYIHDHYKTSLLGASDENGDEDTKMTVSFSGNYWKNCGSRTPSVRFGHVHVWNNYYESNSDGVNTRVGAQVLVENSVWNGCKNTIYATSVGYAVARGNDYGNATANSAPVGTFTTAPYSYSLIAASSVKSSVVANAGQKLTFT